MDPMLPSALSKPIVHFMTRADIYKGFLKHLFHHGHMLPVFRQQDGVDQNEKNEEIFKIVAKEVARGKNVLVFAEGFTDDVFVRSLKPIKKGILRMAFQSLEAMDWREDVYIQTLGINYTHPKYFRSEVLMSYGKKIRVNDFKDAYLANPKKLMQEMISAIESDMKAEITCVEDRSRCEFHENVMQLTRKGLHPESSDFSLPLEQRWRYSQNLAQWLNAQDQATVEPLDTAMKNYFYEMSATPIRENDVYEYLENGELSDKKTKLFNIFLAPVALLGLCYGWISWFIIKPKIEKTFRRDVFWSSAKLFASYVAGLIYFSLLIVILYFLVYPSILLWLLVVVLTSAPSFIVFYHWLQNRKTLQRRKNISVTDLKFFGDKRTSLIKQIRELIPVA
jgi:1-acyl-sn-glycerol-3-phosphate acyltransferase